MAAADAEDFALYFFDVFCLEFEEAYDVVGVQDVAYLFAVAEYCDLLVSEFCEDEVGEPALVDISELVFAVHT